MALFGLAPVAAGRKQCELRPAQAEGRCEVTPLALWTTQALTDARNEGEGAHLSNFYFWGRFVANMKRFLTSETKIGLKMGFGPPNTHSIGEFSKKYFPLFFLPQNPAAPARN